MEKINYKDQEFLYIIEEYDCGEYGYRTHFFNPVPITTYRKKWYLFGPKVEEIIYEKLFTLDYSIRSPKKLKEDIQNDLDRNIKLINRQKEIEQGDIV